MQRIACLLVSFVLLLAACTAITTESAAPAPLDDPSKPEVPAALPVETAPTAMPEPALNEQAAKPQFIMFTASW